MNCDLCADKTARDIKKVNIGNGIKLHLCYDCRKRFGTGDQTKPAEKKEPPAG